MSYRRQWRRRLSVRGRLQLRARKKVEVRRMVCSAECGRALGRLRRSLARLGHTRRGTGDARCCWPPRGMRALCLSATDAVRSADSNTVMDA